jgi:hypothetical protein
MDVLQEIPLFKNAVCFPFLPRLSTLRVTACYVTALFLRSVNLPRRRFQQDRQCMYDVTLRRIRETIAIVEKQKIHISLGVCVCAYACVCACVRAGGGVVGCGCLHGRRVVLARLLP